MKAMRKMLSNIEAMALWSTHELCIKWIAIIHLNPKYILYGELKELLEGC